METLVICLEHISSIFPSTTTVVMLLKMSSSVTIPFGEQDVDCNNARGVVKMAGSADPRNSDNSIFWLKESTVAGVMVGLHSYPRAAVMIPVTNVEQGPYCFVNVHSEVKIAFIIARKEIM